MSEQKKKKKPSQQLTEQQYAQEWKEREDAFKELLKECINIIKIKTKEYDSFIKQADKAEHDLEESKRQQIIRCGKHLEKDLMSDEKDRISARLSKEFEGLISSKYVRKVCGEYNWVSVSKARTQTEEIVEEKDTEQSEDLRNSSANVADLTKKGNESESVTKTEQRYVEAAESDVKTDLLIEELIQKLTGKTEAEMSEYVSRTKNTPLTHWGTILVKESENYIKDQAHKMTDNALDNRLENLKILETVRNKVVDILSDVKDSRKKQQKVHGR